MNGAESLMRTAATAGVELCFANPGTTEMHLVDALDHSDGIRGVLALFEGVVTGAADGYARMSGKAAMTLLHLGPGMANGMANLHNARRARTPVLNVVGHHATWQRNFDPPLNSDVETWAAPVSHWQRTTATARQISRDTADAIAATRQHPGQIATLVVPADCQWDEAGDRIVPVSGVRGARVCVASVERAAASLRDRKALLLLGGSALGERGLRAAGRIAKHAGVRLAGETFAARLERGPHLPAIARVPYFPEQGADFFAGLDVVVLAGALDPVAFFGYQDGPSRLIPDGVEVQLLATPHDDGAAALEDVAAALDAGPEIDLPEPSRPPAPSGALNPANIAQAVLAHLPENAIVVDEGITSAGAFYPMSTGAPAHSYLNLTGGAIGWGLPCSVGAALACPDRRVVVLEGDGSGLYTAQALWTQAREGLDVTTLVFANDVYQILQIELARSGVSEPGPESLGLTDLSRPTIDWVALSGSLGVPATRVESAEDLATAFARSVGEPGPHLIEVKVGRGAVAVP
ncbi:MAG: acetolactate synthase large subunit [Acidobacteria bacterium]|nr:MAG: acetolactate synthase large subunit [Acidobacteriota bacterium]